MIKVGDLEAIKLYLLALSKSIRNLKHQSFMFSALIFNWDAMGEKKQK